MTWRHPLGVLAGMVSAFVITIALSVCMGLAALAYFTVTSLTARQMDFAHLSTSTPILLASLGLGAFALLLGGLFAGWIARSRQVLTGLATGVASIVFSIPFFFLYPYPAWYNVAAVAATLVPAAAGGYLARVFANVHRLPRPAAS